MDADQKPIDVGPTVTVLSGVFYTNLISFLQGKNASQLKPGMMATYLNTWGLYYKCILLLSYREE